MSDSLRDQLMQAGFTAPKEPVRAKRTHTGKAPHTPGKHGGTRGKSTGKHKGQVSHAPTKQRSADNNKRTASGSASGSASAPAADAEALKRKAIKAEIKALIEAAAIKEFQGESVYRFILNQRIRELHVKEDIRQLLVAGSLIITRLNGTTWLVPEATSTAIRALNPDWAVVTPAPDEPEVNDGYEDFPVPDDLQW